jgi:phytoene dehydrogenase-like protein
MKKRKVLIIGGGIAGLSAGSYLVRNGYDTEIFEAHTRPGGVCTSWKRGDYIFDYCIHWLVGTGGDTGFDIVWKELGMLEDKHGKPTPIVNFDDFSRIELTGGDVVRLYSDADRLEEELKRIAPEDTKLIRKFTRELKILAKGGIPAVTDNWNILDKTGYYLKNASSFLTLMKYVRMTMEQFAGKWKNPGLREAFSSIIPPSWSAISLVYGMAFQHTRAAGYPIGGSMPMARNIERRYLQIGGKINYSSKVEKIIVRDDQAVGIRLDSGEEFYGDEIVSAADGYKTLYNMLDGKYLDKKLKEAYSGYSLFPSSVFLGFGVAKDLSDLPHALTIRLDEPLVLPDGSRHPYVSVNIYNFDPTLAPAGKTSVTVILHTWKDSYWKELATKDPSAYKDTKDRLAGDILKILDSRFPGFSGAVQKTDVSTPHSVERYTHNWHGSFEGFAPTPAALMGKLPKEVPGLKNCHMVGQWTTPGGGIPPASLDGRNLAFKLCKRDNIPFHSGLPKQLSAVD